MLLRVPLTGKLVSYDPETKIGVGSDDDPVRPLDFNKLLPEEPNFRWDLVSPDYEGGMALVAITFSKITTETEWDKSKTPPEPLAWRRESDLEFYERQATTEKLLQNALDGKSADELRKITGEPKLIMPRGK